jgi:hypothetical protein
MAYQKLQGLRAINVYPNDDVRIPSPSDLVASGDNDAVAANLLEDSTANFLGKVKPGATVYNTTTNATATVTRVDDTVLTLSEDIFTATPEGYAVYNTDNSEGPVLFVGTGGTLAIKTVGGDLVQLVNVANASFIPIMVGTVQDTGTSASDIIALW